MGVFGVSDPIRDGAAETLASISATGRKVALISGDAQSTADHVGAQLGIDIVVGNTRPDGKVASVNELRAQYSSIAFVGDVVLMSPDPSAVLRALSISHATLRNVRQNLIWAFGYNALLIPVAAGVLVPFGGPQLSPALAALAMALSSFFVVSNALRLRGKVNV